MGSTTEKAFDSLKESHGWELYVKSNQDTGEGAGCLTAVGESYCFTGSE